MPEPANETSSGLTALRDENARRILQALLDSPRGLTQLELSRITELSRSTVSGLLSETLGSVLDDTEERDEGQRGPAPQLWTVARDAAFSVGIDIGQSHVTVALADPYGEIVASASELLDTMSDREPVLDMATALLKRVVGSSERCHRIAAVMVGLPVVVDTHGEPPAGPPATVWEQFDVVAAVTERWPFELIPAVYVENDANLGAIGELNSGAGRGAGSLLYIKWSTGIGSGVILDGKLWSGTSGAAGELGHLRVSISKSDREALRLPPRAEMPECPLCGQRGCLEQVAAGPVLARAIGVEDFRAVVHAAHDPEPRRREGARAALNVAAKLIGTAIGPVLTMLNVERVIVGGLGGNDAYPLVVESIRHGVDQTAPPLARTDAEIEASKLGSQAYVVGGAVSAFEGRGLAFLHATAAKASQSPPPKQARKTPAAPRGGPRSRAARKRALQPS